MDQGERTASSPISGLGAHPNPFNSGTVIRFDLAESGRIRLEIHDLKGRRVWSSGEIESRGGEVRVAWNARDTAGRILPSGAYFYRVIHDGVALAGARITLVK